MPISCTTHIGNGLGECERCRIPLPLIQHDGMSTIPKGRVGFITTQFCGRTAYPITKPEHDSNQLCAP